VRDVARVVDGEADGEHEVDDGHRVDGELPQPHEAQDVDVDQDDAQHHLARVRVGARVGVKIGVGVRVRVKRG